MDSEAQSLHGSADLSEAAEVLLRIQAGELVSCRACGESLSLISVPACAYTVTGKHPWTRETVACGRECTHFSLEVHGNYWPDV